MKLGALIAMFLVAGPTFARDPWTGIADGRDLEVLAVAPHPVAAVHPRRRPPVDHALGLLPALIGDVHLVRLVPLLGEHLPDGLRRLRVQPLEHGAGFLQRAAVF